MTLEEAEAIVELAEEHSGNVELHEEYSGRGMCGETCAAVSGDALLIAWAAGKLGFEPGWRTDSMGRGTVVY